MQAELLCFKEPKSGRNVLKKQERYIFLLFLKKFTIYELFRQEKSTSSVRGAYGSSEFEFLSLKFEFS